MNYSEILSAFAEYAREKKRIMGPKDAFAHFAYLARKRQENFAVATLDSAHQIIKVRVISVGLVNRTIVHPREVFAPAIEDRAQSIIISHNHPSGSTDPSPEDHEITDRLIKAGEILGIQVLDHVIVGKGRFYSFVENRLMDPLGTEE